MRTPLCGFRVVRQGEDRMPTPPARNLDRTEKASMQQQQQQQLNRMVIKATNVPASAAFFEFSGLITGIRCRL
jgi:hypothetical protein